MPSKLEQLQQRYRRQLLQEKEERLIKIHTESQQKALSKVARYNGTSSLPTSVQHHSPVKKGSPGVDRSRPLPPIRSSPLSAAYRTHTEDQLDARPAESEPTPRPGPPRPAESDSPRRPSPPRPAESESPPRPSPPRPAESEPAVRPRPPDKESLHRPTPPRAAVSEPAVRPKPANKESPPFRASPSRSASRQSPSRPSPPRPSETKSPSRSDPEAVARLKQAELQRLRNKVTPARTKSSTPKRTAPPANTAKPTPQVSKQGSGGRKPPGPGQEQCRVCGRNFNADRIEKHASICAKAAKKKVKVFDVTKMRVKGTEAEQFLRKPAAATAQPPPKPKTDWRKQHNEFIEAIRQAKLVQQHLAKGGKVSDLPPPPPSDNSDYVPCPHCGRKFSPGVADRHIPKCKNILSNKKKNPPARRK